MERAALSRVPAVAAAEAAVIAAPAAAAVGCPAQARLSCPFPAAATPGSCSRRRRGTDSCIRTAPWRGWSCSHSRGASTSCACTARVAWGRLCWAMADTLRCGRHPSRRRWQGWRSSGAQAAAAEAAVTARPCSCTAAAWWCSGRGVAGGERRQQSRRPCRPPGGSCLRARAGRCRPMPDTAVACPLPPLSLKILKRGRGETGPWQELGGERGR